MDPSDIAGDLSSVLIEEEDIARRVAELAEEIDHDYAGRPLLMVGVLKGATIFVADLIRAMHSHVDHDWMAVSSYGSGTKSSGVVRILKDLDCELQGRDVLVVEDVLDSGLTLSWLLANLKARHPASVEVVTFLRKPDAVKVDVPVKYVGFDIPNEFVVGYGLDYDQRYRNLRAVATLAPHVYGG